MTQYTKRIVELEPEDLKEIESWVQSAQIHGEKVSDSTQKKVFGFAWRSP